ncbi:putative Outer membrane protein TolC [Nitrospira sp. KM1]|nr:putative Outer membrane protein TolC [Nitrospira sp. KM1]
MLTLCAGSYVYAESGPVAPSVERKPSAIANAQTGPSMTMDEAIRIGIRNHPLIERARQSLLIAKALTRLREGERYPWLDASVAGAAGAMRIVGSDGQILHDAGGHGFNPGGGLPHHNQNMVSGGLLLNQLITNFGYTAHRILAAEATEAAGEKEIQTHKAFVILNVQKAYLDCLLQHNLVSIAAETLKRRLVVRDQIEALYRRQLKSKLDLDLLLVEVSSAELSLIRARNEYQRAFASLLNAMGTDRTDRFELKPVAIVVTPPPPIEALVVLGLNDRPELLGNRDRISASRELLQAVKSQHFGSLSAVGSIGMTQYGTVHDDGIPPDGGAPFWGFGATMQLPLFTGFRIQSQAKEADHRKGETEEELNMLANDIVLQIVRASLTNTTNAEQIALEEERVALASSALQLAQERYRLGLSPIVEVVRATEMLFESESRLAEARYIYKTSESLIAYATGQDYKRY